MLWHSNMFKAPSMSVICHPLICECRPWVENTSIHSWSFSIHGWLLRMTLSSLDEICSAMDKIVVLSNFARVLQSFGALLTKIGNLCEQYMMVYNSIQGWINLIHGWKRHQWMSSMDREPLSMDDIHGWRWQMTKMDRTQVLLFEIKTQHGIW